MTFEQSHPDVVKHARYDKMKTYRSLTEGGRILEAWDRDENGEWHDVTLREQEIQQAEWDLAKAQRELRKAHEEQQ